MSINEMQVKEIFKQAVFEVFQEQKEALRRFVG